MKKLIIAAIASIAILTGTAVAAVQRENTPADAEWTEAEDRTVTPGMQEMFDEATDCMIGVKYMPLELLETQIADGTNYKFLAQMQDVYPGADKKAAVIIIHEDLSGSVSVLEVEEV